MTQAEASDKITVIKQFRVYGKEEQDSRSEERKEQSQ